MAELGAAEISGARVALVATSVFEHDKTVAVGFVFQPPGTRNRGGVLLAIDRMQKNIADRSIEGVDAFDEHDQFGPLKLLEQSRRQQRQFFARLKLAFVFEATLFRPR